MPWWGPGSNSPLLFCEYLFPEEVCVNPMISYTDSCNCSDSSDIELSDEWVGKKSPKLSRGNRSPQTLHVRSYINELQTGLNYINWKLPCIQKEKKKMIECLNLCVKGWTWNWENPPNFHAPIRKANDRRGCRRRSLQLGLRVWLVESFQWMASQR